MIARDCWIAASMLLLFHLTHLDPAGRADYFGLVLNRSARVQGAAHGGQVLAEGLSVDKAVQEWRAMCPQKQSSGTSRMSKYLPGDHCGNFECSQALLQHALFTMLGRSRSQLRAPSCTVMHRHAPSCTVMHRHAPSCNHRAVHPTRQQLPSQSVPPWWKGCPAPAGVCACNGVVGVSARGVLGHFV
jgi:hypothetical protein